MLLLEHEAEQLCFANLMFLFSLAYKHTPLIQYSVLRRLLSVDDIYPSDTDIRACSYFTVTSFCAPHYWESWGKSIERLGCRGVVGRFSFARKARQTNAIIDLLVLLALRCASLVFIVGESVAYTAFPLDTLTQSALCCQFLL
ncbi:hypothetical protein BaRGS_00028023 [Batillaria attramentaria]|uniref:Uncharacterized protein n=1 Tax=Batillaria attramentaria TaxID=370345 RepID=A0ABD0K118_9CAEN